MKSMKKFLVLIATLFQMGLSAWADDYAYLVLHSTDGTEVCFDAQNLKITYSDGRLIATEASSPLVFDLSTLSYMVFASTAYDAAKVGSATGETSLVRAGEGSIVVNTQTDAAVRICAADGSMVAHGRVAGGETKTFGGGLRPGLYIVRIGSETTKIAVK